MKFLDEAKAEGKAKLATGGNQIGSKGYFVEPTILTDVPIDSRINKEEVFGPVSVVHQFETEEEAIELANDT
jgi:aldehyde dehydrogenase (NAD+)